MKHLIWDWNIVANYCYFDLLSLCMSSGGSEAFPITGSFMFSGVNDLPSLILSQFYWFKVNSKMGQQKHFLDIFNFNIGTTLINKINCVYAK